MSNFSTTHYGLAMRIDALAEEIGNLADNVQKICHDKNRTPLFCYSGMSGVAHGTALALAYHKKYGPTFGLAYVRKDEEISHGHKVEYTANMIKNKKVILVFVDDCIDSGKTVAHTIKKTLSHFEKDSVGELIFNIKIDKTCFIAALNNSCTIRHQSECSWL